MQLTKRELLQRLQALDEAALDAPVYISMYGEFYTAKAADYATPNTWPTLANGDLFLIANEDGED